MRVLQSTIRSVAGDPASYREAWQTVERSAAQNDARAWIFRSAGDALLHIEFLEWKQPAGADVSLPAPLAEQWLALARFGAGSTQQWIEVE